MADPLWEVLDAAVEEIVETVREVVPVYRSLLDGGQGPEVRAGTRQTLAGMLELIASPEAAARLPRREFYVELGRREFGQGRSLDALLAATRAGAQVAWRELAAAGDRAGVEPRVLYTLAEALFAYVDELSAAVAEGHAQARTAAAGERQARRRLVLELLCTEPPVPAREVELAAAQAGWPLPRRLAALAVVTERPEDVVARLPVDALHAPVDGLTVAIVPDPDGPGRRRQVEAAAGGARAALGPTVEWSGAATSVRRARQALEVFGPSDELVVADELMLDLLLAADPDLVADLQRRVLAPLEAVAPSTRRRLEDTLRAWLDHQGEVRPAAEALHVHPQTVRYRVSQLRDLFGDALDDPRARLELALALRAR